MDEPACTWRRRMTNDGQAFARIIKYSKGFAIQKVQSSVTCAEHLTNLTKEQFDTCNAGVLESIHVASLCICLGSVAASCRSVQL